MCEFLPLDTQTSHDMFGILIKKIIKLMKLLRVERRGPIDFF